MILFIHMLVGAVIATEIKFLPLAIMLAFLSHYFLDSLPHAEYSIENIKKKKWNKSGPDFLKLTLDLITGAALILIICHLTGVNYLVVFTVSFFSILPDILTISSRLLPNNKILRKHFNFHQKIHFPKDSAPEQVQ